MLGDVGADGDARVSASRASVSQKGTRPTARDSRLDDVGVDYGGGAQRTEEQVLAVSLPGRAPLGVVGLA